MSRAPVIALPLSARRPFGLDNDDLTWGEEDNDVDDDDDGGNYDDDDDLTWGRTGRTD